MTKKPQAAVSHTKLSLAPLTVDEALEALLWTPAPPSGKPDLKAATKQESLNSGL